MRPSWKSRHRSDWEVIMKTDYGTSYFDALKKYVHLQKKFDAYKKQVRADKIAVAFVASCAILLQVFLSLFNYISN